jgi:glycosyltransferase involved in cell wall biosynthesis
MTDVRRVAVLVPCHNDGELVAETVYSVREPEPVEVVIVDDGSTDGATPETLRGLEAEGYRVLRLPSGLGTAMARNAGVEATDSRYVFPLDADDLAVPGALTRMADRLDARPEAEVCIGDYEEFRVKALVRTVPERLDPYRVAYTNEYPPAALFRRDVLESVGGWTRLIDELDARADWNLWMSLAERGLEGVHFGHGQLTYLRRMHGGRLAWAGRRHNRRLYDALRAQHPKLFAERRAHRSASDLSRRRALMYPIIYGRRPRSRLETVPKALLDRLGVWTLTGAVDDGVRQQMAATFAAAQRHRRAPAVRDGGPAARVAVLIPCHGDGPFVGDTVRSIAEPEPVEVVVVDDGSPDGATHAALDRLEADGHRVIRRPRNEGVSAARNAGLDATTAPYVFPLDADDLAVPGMLSRMADRLERSREAAVCFGDHVEFRFQALVRAVPEQLDPYRLAYANDYPSTALFRRETIEAIGGWRQLVADHADHDLWMTLAERGATAVHLGSGELSYRRRIDANRDRPRTLMQDPQASEVARSAHPGLFDRLEEHRRGTDMGFVRRSLYPFVHGRRSGLRVVSPIKSWLGRWRIGRTRP